MATLFIPSDMFINGNLRCKTFTPPANCIRNAAIASDANVDAEKLKHQYLPSHSQPGNVAEGTFIIHIANAAGTWKNFGVLIRNAPTDEFTVDVQKNGTTILTDTLLVDSSTVEDEVTPLEIDGTGEYAEGDVFSVVVNSSGSALGSGLFVQGMTREEAGV